jgi:hypothetical protein
MSADKSYNKFFKIKPPTLRRTRAVEEKESKVESKLGLEVKEPLKKGRKTGKSLGDMDLPPTIECTPLVRKHTFRFVATSTNGAAGVSAADVIGTLGTVCHITNSSVRPFCSSFRIKKVSLWSDANNSSDQNCSVSWALATGNQARDTESNRSLPAGVSVSGKVVSRPPRGTLASLWQAASSANLMFIGSNSGSVLDLDVEYTISNQIISAVQTVATGVLGQIYYLYLDGSTTHVWQPEGLPNTF